MEKQELSKQEFTERMRMRVLADKVMEYHEPAIRRKDGAVLELKAEGRFADLRSQTRGKRDARTQAVRDDASVGEEELVGWYERRYRPIHEGLDAHAQQRGFHSRREFLTELLATYLAETSAT
jgi:hypothetical protein